MKRRAILVCIYDYVADADLEYELEDTCEDDEKMFLEDPSFMLADGRITVKVEDL